MRALSLPFLSRLPRKNARSGFWRRIALAYALRRHRRQLARLDSRLLLDIGLSHREAEAEAARPFWDAPGHWYH
ncbi:DUF1127 domain-containing protein [Pseudomonas sp. GX19020]|uniref:DUF1127 domain-containing protein n=1 Tax=Pseudomonadota TaxID=1224 RepID=UPI00089D1FC2|nr:MULTISPECIES: DUF1127 domain-containing protein [Pseudomonadota]MCL4066846.1 DUF1127 domain-containing protein [Pseudomonas sp. GX19020]SEB55736.1 Uncharacterized conserved protein YjiS, DUF1127 family [Rhodobacter sp. 24-YEA-8]